MTDRQKHAYLIICHNNFEILEMLIKSIDHKRNDIYIHIDKKCKNVPFEKIKQLPVYSKIYFTKRNSITWGDYSQIKAELTLLKSAIAKEYKYYHLISGVDFCLKSQEEIHSFFDENEGKKFIHYEESREQINRFIPRVQWYYFFQRKIGRDKSGKYGLLQHKLLKIQKRLGLDRTRRCEMEFQYGSNWFSITHRSAKYVVEQEKVIKKHFSKSVCGDELFLQTIILNSNLKKFVVNDNKRLIDWKRGRPYTFIYDDYQELINSDKLFARKFNEDIDIQIIKKLYEYVNKDKER